MAKFQNAKIYKLSSEDSEKVYIGSTCKELRERLIAHEVSYKSHLKGTTHFKSSYEIVKLGNHKIALIEAYPCSNFEELRKREQFWMDSNNCCNILRAHRDRSLVEVAEN